MTTDLLLHSDLDWKQRRSERLNSGFIDPCPDPDEQLIISAVSMLDRRDHIMSRIMARCVRVGDCLIWQGPHSGSGRGGGYPRMSLDGQTVAVHRVVYTHHNGYIPSRKQIDHVCMNRLCLERDHLELVTHLQNQKRRAAAQKGN